MERRGFFRSIAGLAGAGAVAEAAAWPPALSPADGLPVLKKPADSEMTIKVNADTAQLDAALDRIKEKMGGFPVRLEAGGVYVIEMENYVSASAYIAIQESLNKSFPGVRFLLLEKGMKIAR